MSPTAKTWILRLLKLAVCGVALWYLSRTVTLNDYVRLAEDPHKTWMVVRADEATLQLRDVKGWSFVDHLSYVLPPSLQFRQQSDAELRLVPRPALAADEQVRRLGIKSARPVEMGLFTILRDADGRWVFFAWLAMGPSVLVLAWRLRLLLSIQEITLSVRDAILLCFAGNFFNFAMPGTTGGDVYKAYHIARRTPRKAEAITVIFIDRVIGLISFLLLSGATILATWRMGLIGVYGRWVGYLIAVFFVCAGLYFSQRVRHWIGYEKLLSRLPFAEMLRRIDATAFSFRHHPGKGALTLLVTFANHCLVVISAFFLAWSLGARPIAGSTNVDLFMAVMLAAVVGYLLASVPISIQGFGLLEAVFYQVLVAGGWCTASQMIALTIGVRLIQVTWSLPGIIVPWLGFERPGTEKQ